MFGPVTDRERTGWQMQSLAALQDLVRRGHDLDLPPLTWTVSPGLNVIGHVDPFADNPKATMFAWLRETPEIGLDYTETHDGGHIRLRATGRIGPNDRVKLAVVAEYFEREGSEE